MSDLFLNKFRIESSRLEGYDYSSPGIYFITILTDAQISFFGKIVNCRMHLSSVGRIVLFNWLKLPEQFTSVVLDDFIIMPDHLHGLVIITKQINCSSETDKSNSVAQIEES